MRNLDYLLHYDIISASTGYTLKIWEPVPNTDRILYKLQYRLTTEEDAWKLLQMLVSYLGSPVSNPLNPGTNTFSRSGELVVRPAPTLSLG
ncbi:MAG: hypothetical protein ACO4AI_09755 [Prochlorothrix sp.]|nr:hypothetical protein [Prochlorothrix sp.]